MIGFCCHRTTNAKLAVSPYALALFLCHRASFIVLYMNVPFVMLPTPTTGGRLTNGNFYSPLAIDITYQTAECTSSTDTLEILEGFFFIGKF